MIKSNHHKTKVILTIAKTAKYTHHIDYTVMNSVTMVKMTRGGSNTMMINLTSAE